MHLATEDVGGCRNFLALKAIIETHIDSWAPLAASGTKSAFLRGLEAAAHRVGHLIRSSIEREEDQRIGGKRAQMTVVDIHNLHDRAKRFVIGVILKRMFEEKESVGTARPLVFVVLDEPNKYLRVMDGAQSKMSFSTWLSAVAALE